MSLSVSANAHNINNNNNNNNIIIIIIIISSSSSSSITVIISYHLSARYLQPRTWNKPCFYGI
jgi:hypothetical protein